MNGKGVTVLLFLLLGSVMPASGDDGYRLWLKYDQISDKAYLNECSKAFKSVIVTGDSPVLKAAHEELLAGLGGMTGRKIEDVKNLTRGGTVVAGTFESSPLIATLLPDVQPGTTGDEGYHDKIGHTKRETDHRDCF